MSKERRHNRSLGQNPGRSIWENTTDTGMPAGQEPKDIGEASVTATIPAKGKRAEEKPGATKKRVPKWVLEQQRLFGIKPEEE